METNAGGAVDSPADVDRQRAAARELYRREAAPLVRLATVLVGNRSIAESWSARRASPGVRAGGPAATRRLPRATVADLALALARGRRADAGPRRRAEPDRRSAMRSRRWSALQRLPDRQREALVLRYYLDLPDDQIARAPRRPTGDRSVPGEPRTDRPREGADPMNEPRTTEALVRRTLRAHDGGPVDVDTVLDRFEQGALGGDVIVPLRTEAPRRRGWPRSAASCRYRRRRARRRSRDRFGGRRRRGRNQNRHEPRGRHRVLRPDRASARLDVVTDRDRAGRPGSGPDLPVHDPPLDRSLERPRPRLVRGRRPGGLPADARLQLRDPSPGRGDRGLVRRSGSAPGGPHLRRRLGLACRETGGHGAAPHRVHDGTFDPRARADEPVTIAEPTTFQRVTVAHPRPGRLTLVRWSRCRRTTPTPVGTSPRSDPPAPPEATHEALDPHGGTGPFLRFRWLLSLSKYSTPLARLLSLSKCRSAQPSEKGTTRHAVPLPILEREGAPAIGVER